MPFAFKITIEYLNGEEESLQSPPYRVSIGETGELMSLIPMQHGSVLDLPIFEVKSQNGNLIVSEYTTDGHFGRLKPIKKNAKSIWFEGGIKL